MNAPADIALYMSGLGRAARQAASAGRVGREARGLLGRVLGTDGRLAQGAGRGGDARGCDAVAARG